MIEVPSWGIASSVVDCGRPGRCWLGQSRGGAVDLRSHALGNRLVGNTECSAAFETSGGLHLVFSRPTMVAVTGAVAEIGVEGGPPVGWGSPVVLPAGAVMRIGRLLDGARLYVAVRGGVQGGGGPYTAGPDPGEPAASQPASRATRQQMVRVWPGPRLDWFAGHAWQQLLRTEYVVSETSRVGTRLRGEPLVRAVGSELPSEGMIEGAVQVPPDGQPIVMLADHPTTGGYPVIAVVDPEDLHLVGQAAAGTTLRFRAARR